MSKGILLSAWGKRGYIYAAYNLAFSLKHFNRQVPITLYCEESILSQIGDDKKWVFDEIISIPEELLSLPPAQIKISAFDILPYDHNLILDVDALALQDIEPCLDEMIEAGGAYYSHVLNLHSKGQGNDIPQMVWATEAVIWEKYKLSDEAVLPCINSSFQYIKKCEQSTKLIKQLKENLADPIPLEKLKSQWGASQPDELYMNVALAQLGMTAKTDREYMFMGFALSPKPLHVIDREYFILSVFGGHRFTKARYTEHYDRKLIKYCYAQGQHCWYKYRHIVRDKHANIKPIKFTAERMARDRRLQALVKPLHIGKADEKVTFYSSWYKDKHPKRQGELDRCLKENLKTFARVVVVSEHDCPIEHPQLEKVKLDHRPTYDDFIQAINERAGEHEISVIANGDIYFDEKNANKLKAINFTGRSLALSRWEEDINGFKKHFNYEWSQDAWIFKGKVKPISCKVHLGTMQCDGRFAYEMKQAGYEVINPSKDIQAVHVHKAGERGYDVDASYKEPKHPVVPEKMDNYVKQRLLIIQPGKVGDILICAPMARHFSHEYFVDWQCPVSYHPLFDSFPYVTPIEKANEKDYQVVKDLSFGLGGKPERWWQQNKTSFNSFVEAKYELAGLPAQMKDRLEWTRNEAKEKELLEKVVGKKRKFALVHDSSHYGGKAEIETELPIVKFAPVEGYTILDWFAVVQKASEIHCIDSSLCNFVDMIETKAKLFYYQNGKVPNKWDETMLNKKWIRNEVSIAD